MRIFGKKGPSGFSATSTAEKVTRGIDATGLTAIVTGASSGIGVETTCVLVLRGAHVVNAVRNTEAGNNVKEVILKEIPDAKLDVMELDLSSSASVRKFAEEYISLRLPLNILINNAGMFLNQFKLSEEKVELHFATNHLGHFLLTNLLLENMKQTSRESGIEGRIVIVSSVGHKYAYPEGIRFDTINEKSRCKRSYAESKLANVLHANELKRRLKEEQVQITVNSLHPGMICTKIVRDSIPIKWATRGIGLETVRVLALQGVHVVMATRDMNYGKKMKEEMLKEIPDAKIDVMKLDLSSFASVREFAAEYNTKGLPLNILINNAGFITPFQLSEDNIELQFSTNYLGHLLLTNLLLENMKRMARESNKEGRIVNVSSAGHKYSYREGIRFDKINDKSSFYKYIAYNQSKLAILLHANELAKCLKEEGVEITANSLHPGIIQTNIVRISDNGILHYIEKGISGHYFADCNIVNPSEKSKDTVLATKLWDFNLNLSDLN